MIEPLQDEAKRIPLFDGKYKLVSIFFIDVMGDKCHVIGHNGLFVLFCQLSHLSKFPYGETSKSMLFIEF